MTVTWEQAQGIVRAQLEPDWDDSTDGEFYVADEGLQDDRGFIVPAGAYEFLVEGDPDYAQTGERVPYVDKATGEFSWFTIIVEFDRYSAMKPAP